MTIRYVGQNMLEWNMGGNFNLIFMEDLVNPLGAIVLFRRPLTSGGTPWPSNWHRFQTNTTVTNSCYFSIARPLPLVPSRCICIPSSKPGIQLAFFYLRNYFSPIGCIISDIFLLELQVPCAKNSLTIFSERASSLVSHSSHWYSVTPK
jgi:hypothetical protein